MTSSGNLASGINIDVGVAVAAVRLGLSLMVFATWWTLRRRREKRTNAVNESKAYVDGNAELPANGVGSPGKVES